MRVTPRSLPSCCLILAGLLAVVSGRDTAVGGQPGAVDFLGNPLPEHARARLGTARFRAGTLINQVIYTPDGKSLVAIDQQAAIRLWDLRTGRIIRRIGERTDGFREMALSPDGKQLASNEDPGRIRLWDLATGRELRKWHQADNETHEGPRFSADGRLLATKVRRDDAATGKPERSISLRESAASGERRRLLRAEWLEIWAFEFSPDGRSLMTLSVDEQPARGPEKWSIRVFDLGTLQARRRIPIDVVDPRAVAFSPDGKTVASERRIWDADTGRVLVDFRDQDEQNNRSASFFPTFISSDGRQAITSEEDGVRVWDMASGAEARRAVRARIHQDRVALSRDGRYVATGALVARFQGDESAPPIDVWEMASGQKVANLVGHAGSTNGLCFSPDGRWLASCSGDRRTGLDATVRIWDVATGRELRRFSGHDGPVNVVAFAPDGRTVISGGADGTGLVWDVSDLQADRPAGEPLTREALQARWDELAGADARAAHRATWALGVPSAVGFLREHLRPASAPVPKGVPAASGPIAPPGILRSLRAIAALEHAGTPEARAALELMANGHPAAIETREAKASLDRLRESKARP